MSVWFGYSPHMYIETHFVWFYGQSVESSDPHGSIHTDLRHQEKTVDAVAYPLLPIHGKTVMDTEREYSHSLPWDE